MFGIRQMGHDGPATAVYLDINDAQEALRQFPPGSAIFACDSKGNPVAAPQPVAPAPQPVFVQPVAADQQEGE